MWTALFWLLVLVPPLYFVIGLFFAWFLSQTPYADNPAWTFVLLWPLYLRGL